MPPVVATVRDWSEALLTSLSAALTMMFAAIPKIIGFILIVAIGWFVATLIAKAAAALLRAVRFNELANRSGFTEILRNIGVEQDSAGFLATLAKWFIRLIVLVVAFDALGLPAVSDVLRQVLLWLPNLAVALVVMVIGGLAAKSFGNVVHGAMEKAQVGNPEVLATVARFAIWAFAIIIAANQIGIADELVNTLFMGAVAILVLAFGLSFGLGARDTAGEIVRNWYQKGLENKDKVKSAGRAFKEKGAAANPFGESDLAGRH
jgi:Mechanosensitive ion channel, conserved TM helix